MLKIRTTLDNDHAIFYCWNDRCDSLLKGYFDEFMRFMSQVFILGI